MKLNYLIIAIGMLIYSTIMSCSENFLEVYPYGKLSEAQLSNEQGIEMLLIGAYNLVDFHGTFWIGDGVFFAPDDARLGATSGVSKYNVWEHDASDEWINDRWTVNYNFILRCNNILNMLPKIKKSTEELLQIEAEAKFLRGFGHLRAVMMWGNVPWIDETIDVSHNNYLVRNDVNIYPYIENDFMFAAENLTETKNAIGRANKWAAKSFLAKTYMFQNKFQEAKIILDDIIANGQTSNGLKYALCEKYNDNFRTATKHGPECVFAFQMSTRDNASTNNANTTDRVNGTFDGVVNMGFGWFQPTFDLVNAFQTDSITGLPLFDSYFETPIKNDYNIRSDEPFEPYSGTLDSRLDWCVGRRGIPYRDWGINLGFGWVRSQITAGPYTSIKHCCEKARVDKDREASGGYTNTPYNAIRFADVLLWAAECEVEVGSLQKAENYVNMIRARAANPEGFVHTYINPDEPLQGFTNIPAANYKVGLYNGQFEANGRSYARKAVRFERRLELAMEHHRYFDMLRYDGNDFDVASTHNTVIKREAQELYLNQASFYNSTKGFIRDKCELQPIPLIQIDLSIDNNGISVLTQNPGW